MSPSSEGEASTPAAPSSIVIIDTGAIIELKRVVAIGKQWQLLTRMSSLVEAGQLAFPPQVHAELTRVKFPDAPGVWAAGCKGHVRHGQPSDAEVAAVLQVAQLVDLDAEAEAADPYVVALALSLQRRHPDSRVVIATSDHVDRLPVKESVATACARLGLECWKPPEFVQWVESC